MTTITEAGIGALLETINQLEAEAHDAESEPSDIRWEQAKHVAAVLDAGMSERELAGKWLSADTGRPYSRAHVRFTNEVWHVFGHLSAQQRPRYNFAYNSPDVRGPGIAPMQQSNSNEWYTPQKYIEAARDLMDGIDLDPASNADANKGVKADQYFSKEDDGLSQQWHGHVWLNPPYGGLSGPFVAKLLEEYTADRVTEAVLLVNANSTDTDWFAPLWGYVLCFTDHRINFLSPVGAFSNSTHGSVFVYLGENQEGFYQHFKQFGAVVSRYRP